MSYPSPRHKITLCDPASFGCMTVLFEPTQNRESVVDAVLARIERLTGMSAEPWRDEVGRQFDKETEE